MDAFLTAIYSKITTGPSALWNDVGGSVYIDQYDGPVPTTYPFIIIKIISSFPDRTFTERYNDIVIQFSLLSKKSVGLTEITSMYNHLISLFDECSMTITGYTLVWMRENSLAVIPEDVDMDDGTTKLSHWSCDFDARISKN